MSEDEKPVNWERVLNDLKNRYELIIEKLESRIEELSRRDDPTGKWIA